MAIIRKKTTGKTRGLRGSARTFQRVRARNVSRETIKPQVVTTERFPTEVDLLLGGLGAGYENLYVSDNLAKAERWLNNYINTMDEYSDSLKTMGLLSDELEDSLDEIRWNLLSDITTFLEGQRRYEGELALRVFYYDENAILNLERIISRWSQVIEDASS